LQEEVFSLHDKSKGRRQMSAKQSVRRTFSDDTHQHQQLPALTPHQLSQVKTNCGTAASYVSARNPKSVPCLCIIGGSIIVDLLFLFSLNMK